MAITATICDQLGRDAHVVDPLFTDFGGALECAGPMVVLRTFEHGALAPTVVEEPGDGQILVIDAGGSERCAAIGTEVVEKALSNGWAGIVVNGCVRDSEALSQLEMPIKALNVHPRAPDARTDGERDVPVSFGGVVFEPGEWLYADLDGVVVSATQVEFE
ncbi:ribonuclease E activity regulator RraA [Salinisphaera sp. USBA-960]|uniref:ribonuclease E activity regulator RraA n=1 Tax=Salinisphaera orenii TaxID=856731 RepID=UPI000DBE3FDD|nr:ribonuclease E activity regulator RraA [Salifodinibacter halophilus]NNC25921.1 ribonuclease E activity regulator RraA [Salifodinibacter halophilus]